MAPPHRERPPVPYAPPQAQRTLPNDYFRSEQSVRARGTGISQTVSGGGFALTSGAAP